MVGIVNDAHTVEWFVKTFPSKSALFRECQGIGNYMELWIMEYFQWIRNGGPTSTKFMVYATVAGELCGLAGCVVRPESIYIDFMCSIKKGMGTMMLERIQREGVRLGKRGVELVSVPDAVRFYTRQGFKRGPLPHTRTNTDEKKRFRIVQRFDPLKKNGLMNALVKSRQEFQGKYDGPTLAKYFPNVLQYYDFIRDLQRRNLRRAFRRKIFINEDELQHALPKFFKYIKSE